jgi:hypothetical protein
MATLRILAYAHLCFLEIEETKNVGENLIPIPFHWDINKAPSSPHIVLLYVEFQTLNGNKIKTLYINHKVCSRNTGVYPKVSGLAAWSQNCKWYSSLPLGAVVSLFYESV